MKLALMQRRFVHLNLFMLSLPESFAHDAYTDCFMMGGMLCTLAQEDMMLNDGTLY